MHVTIDRGEKRKFLSQRNMYTVTLTVTFSEEEKAIAFKEKLGEQYAILFTYEIELKSYLYSVSHRSTGEGGWTFNELHRGPQTREFKSVSDANDWEHELRTKRLPIMKNIFERHKGPKSSGPKSFEL